MFLLFIFLIGFYHSIFGMSLTSIFKIILVNYYFAYGSLRFLGSEVTYYNFKNFMEIMECKELF
jgi:hypothetical protein